MSTIWQEFIRVQAQPIPRTMRVWDRLLHILCAVSAFLVLLLLFQPGDILIENQVATPLWLLLVPCQMIGTIVIALWLAWYLPWRSTSTVDQRIGRVAATICILSILATPFGLLQAASSGDSIYRLALIGIHCQQLWLIRRGYIRAGIVLLVMAYVIFNLADQSAATASFATGFLMTVLIVGLLIRGWAGMLIALGLPLMQAAFQIAGLIPNGPNWSTTLGLITVYLIISIIIAQYANSLESALAGEAARSVELAASQQELRESTAKLLETQQRWTIELEQTVAQRTIELAAANESLQRANQQLRTFSAQAADLAVEQERTRVAREIHDGLGQHLDALYIHLGVMEQYVDTDPDLVRTSLQIASTEAQAVKHEVRRAINALLADHTAGSLEELLVADVHACALAGIVITTEVRGSSRSLPSPIAHALYRMGQEALNNVRRHSFAEHARLILHYSDPQRVRLTVTDDGQGFDPGSLSAGRGLTNLRERAALVGGTLELVAAPGQGVTVTVEVPTCINPSGS